MRTVEWEATIGTNNSPLEDAMKQKIAPFAALLKLLPMESFLTEVKIQFEADYSPWFDFWSPIFFVGEQHVT